jgi:hypothetical protein
MSKNIVWATTTMILLLIAILPGPQSAVAAPGDVSFRVNAGGPQLNGTPAWTEDPGGNPSPYVSSSTKSSGTTSAIDISHSSLPPGTPELMFKKNRYDPAAAPEMQWDFPLAPGNYEVRLYFAETYAGTQAIGARVFDVSIEGSTVLNDYDIFAEVGANKGVMKSFVITSDNNLDIDFGHVVQNPQINGIEIVEADVGASSTLGAFPSTISFSQTQVGSGSNVILQLTNLGSSGSPSIIVDDAVITGANPAQFSEGFDESGSVNLPPGGSTSIDVTFSPTSTGPKSATLSIYHSGSNSPLNVPLNGEGVGSVPIAFGKSSLQGETSNSPTSLQFGPDGRLYVAQFNGQIKIYDVVRNGANSYSVTSTQTLDLVQSIPNHNDDGALNTNVKTRLVTGLLAAGTASNPVLYVTSSDPRIGGGASGTDLNLDTNSGIISRLRWTGSSWDKLDIVRGLPRSEENHTANGMALDAATNMLYVAQGGNTNRGAPSNNFALLPEFALSAAILSVNLDAIGNSTYDLPTLNDEDRPGNPDANDPFGGNDGKNQAKLVAGGPVRVHAPGFRNPYDVLITSGGRMYSVDNNGNGGWGDIPINEGPLGNCNNQPNEPGTGGPDHLHLVTGSGYYAGHPNPTRANMNNKFNPSSPQSPVSVANPIECDYQSPTQNGSLTTFQGSTNGLAEYWTHNFSGAMKGDLIAGGYSKNAIYRAKFNSTGNQVESQEQLFSTVGTHPLDVTIPAPGHPFPGTIWTGDFNGTIHVFEPSDFGGGGGGGCSGANDPSLDDDGDGYSNADEIANGTNPCSAADMPPDFDGDKISDLNDPDDDNDGIPDVSDPFAIDALNGTGTDLPVSHTWENDAGDPGGFLNLGWTGLMTNGTSDYLTQFDPDNIIAGGAAGVMTVEAVPEGDAFKANNSQRNGFQVGFNPRTSGRFTAHTSILAPFAGITPSNYQSMGLYVGTGDQDNYVKIVIGVNNGTNIQFVKEIAGTVQVNRKTAVTLPGPDFINLYLTVNADNLTVQPSFAVTTGGVTGPRQNLGSPVPVPSSWLAAPMAGGVISTSKGPAPSFPATWDFIEVVEGDGPSGGGAGGAGTWETRAPTGVARAEISYVKAGNRFYLTGGTQKHQAYDPSTNSWTVVKQLPQKLNHIQGVEVGGKVYYIGGLSGWPSPHSSTVHIYDPASNTFSQGAPMPRGRGAGGVAVHNGKIYYAGGLHDGVAVPWFDVYDPVADSWTQLPDMPGRRDHFHAAVLGGKLYAIGGRTSDLGINAMTNQNAAFNFTSGQWETGLAPLPTARGGFAAAVLGTEILIIGGEGGGQAHGTVEAYDTSTNSWRSLAPMPTPRHGIQAVVCNGGVYIADGGGTQGGGGAVAVHEVFFLNAATSCS